MKIKYDDAAYILNYQKQHWFQKRLCTFTVTHLDNGGYRVIGEIKLPVYILLVIPHFILQIFYNIWYCGLSSGGYILERKVMDYYAAKYDYMSDIIRERFPQLTD